MKRQRSFIVMCSILLLGRLFLQAQTRSDNCVDCHQALPADTFVGHSFSDWHGSVHGQKNIACSACHGGHPEASSAAAAHQGLLSSNDKNSSLYFTNIPDTCGKCHAGILGQFKKSVHYSELKKSGRGPNCLTCHGSMATWVLKPDQMEQSCSLCHRKPTQAQAALMSLRLAQTTVAKMEASAPSEKGDARFKALKEDLKGVVQLWHSFDMKAVLESSRRVIKRAHELSTDWKLQPQKEK
jgi:hypothetical protein